MSVKNMRIDKEKRLGDNGRVDILGVEVDILTMDQTVDLVERYMRTKTPLHLMGVNADKINSLDKYDNMREIINSCGIVNADGASVVLASKYLGGAILPERVAGIDLMMKLIDMCAIKGYKIYLLGAKPEVINRTKEELLKRHINLRIVGAHDGYFAQSEWSGIATEVKESGADIVFVGITSPTKEYLIEFLQSNGCDAVFMGVGGSFDVIANEVGRAPKWVQNINMEWFYRFLQEPRRLFKRYFVGNFSFMNSIRHEKRLRRRSSRGKR